jgi:deoxyhypusine synthase
MRYEYFMILHTDGQGPVTPQKADYLRERVEHIDIKRFDARPIVEAMGRMAFQARNLHRAMAIYEAMLREPEGGVILCLAGSLVSAGLKQVVVDLIRHCMVDVVVSTGANIVDQDFFEGLGYAHYLGSPRADDQELRALRIDRIYDTYLDEDELRECDLAVARLAAELEPRPYSSRELVAEMGRFLARQTPRIDGIVLSAFEMGVPIFCPAFSDCSAGFGLVLHQWQRRRAPHLSVDSVRDFLELTQVKLAARQTGLFMIGGGVPKNFAQDVVVAADVLGLDVPMHKYAVQITVADERDGGLSGSTLREACSWGKVSPTYEQMVFGEATVLVPLLVSAVFHGDAARERRPRRYADLFSEEPAGGEQTPSPATP